jgi:organic radical activating enzyme
MAKLHYTELFYSIQGEGRYMGVPSIFLRTFGCNFRCKNFGRYGNDFIKDKTINPEVSSIIKNIDQYKTFKDLPLINSGCDTYGSIYPEFKRFAIKENTDNIAEQIVSLLPYGEWRDEHLVITGGEPLLGWQRAYPDLLEHPKMHDLKEITFETNGTQELSKEFKEYLELTWSLDFSKQLTFSVSPKLSCSGESRAEAIRPDIICSYEEIGYTYLKFVVATEEDAQEAMETVKDYRTAGFQGPVYLMPVGGVESVYALNNRRVADLAMRNGLRYSDRLQVPLFKNAWGT